MDFSQRLRELRKQRGLTQEELAKELEMAKSSISMYENGKRKPSFEVLELFADFFNVNLDTLYGASPVSSKSFTCTPEEEVMIKKFRSLTPTGKQSVLAILDIQYQAVAPKIKKRQGNLIVVSFERN